MLSRPDGSFGLKYIGNKTDVIHISILHRVRDEIKQELKYKYDQVYIEIIPD